MKRKFEGAGKEEEEKKKYFEVVDKVVERLKQNNTGQITSFTLGQMFYNEIKESNSPFNKNDPLFLYISSLYIFRIGRITIYSGSESEVSKFIDDDANQIRTKIDEVFKNEKEIIEKHEERKFDEFLRDMTEKFKSSRLSLEEKKQIINSALETLKQKEIENSSEPPSPLNGIEKGRL